MPSPVYQGFQQNQQQNNFLTTLIQFKKNPMSVLTQRYNIPQNINDPNQILQHLLNTNQVSQEQVNRAMQMGNDPQIQQLLR
jgi:hypothetical protein